MAIRCAKCKTNCVMKESKADVFGYPCECCRRVYCKNCANISATEIRALIMSSRVVLFFCEDCKNSIKQVPTLKDDIQEIKKDIGELKDAIKPGGTTYADVVKTFEKKKHSLKKEFKELENRLKENARKQIPDLPSLDAIKADIRNLESEVITKETARNSNFEPAQEREARAKSVLVFSLPEIQEFTYREDRMEKDENGVYNVLKEINPSINIDNLKIMRIGKYEVQKVRPVKVIFPNKGEAAKCT
ncbi:unnamed protein product [Ceutorhynchus assimilis]|uniref:Uncharacterized protein n=1 Tax=Ceutorhynchus assimilis TaxID=467358 RepID=A0A9N9QQ24_9CUCU|nr:unnamed protein product [Ceutorhynchus assimilis]